MSQQMPRKRPSRSIPAPLGPPSSAHDQGDPASRHRNAGARAGRFVDLPGIPTPTVQRRLMGRIERDKSLEGAGHEADDRPCTGVEARLSPQAATGGSGRAKPKYHGRQGQRNQERTDCDLEDPHESIMPEMPGHSIRRGPEQGASGGRCGDEDHGVEQAELPAGIRWHGSESFTDRDHPFDYRVLRSFAMTRQGTPRWGDRAGIALTAPAVAGSRGCPFDLASRRAVGRPARCRSGRGRS